MWCHFAFTVAAAGQRQLDWNTKMWGNIMFSFFNTANTWDTCTMWQCRCGCKFLWKQHNACVTTLLKCPLTCIVQQKVLNAHLKHRTLGTGESVIILQQ